MWQFPKTQPKVYLTPTSVKSLAFHPNGRILAVGDGKGQVWLWDVSKVKPIGEVLPLTHRGAVTALAFHPNGTIMLSGGEDANLFVWKVLSRSVQKQLIGWHQREIRAVAFRPDGQFAVSCSMDDRLRVWRTSDWQVVITREGGRNWALALAFSPDGALIASASKDETVKVWRTRF